MGRLRAALQAKYKNRDEDVKIHSPRNLETLNLTFRPERVAKVIGSLAAKLPQTNDVLSGLLVSKDYSYTLLDPRDLRDFAGLSTCTVTQRQKIALGVGWGLVRWHLEGMYGHIEEGHDQDGIPTIRVCSSYQHGIKPLRVTSGDGCGGCEAGRRNRTYTGMGFECRKRYDC
jgi:cleavage and polyadenylation specificity factor subunit 3